MTARRDRLIEDTRHDPYRAKRKPKEFTVCRQCGLGFSEGRWQVVSNPWPAGDTLCPACQRTNDDYPAGYLEISGPFYGEHREEIERLLDHVAEREGGEHPLERVMERVDQPDGTRLVMTTGSHLARAMAYALERAYGGELEVHHAESQNLVRASWSR